MTSCVTQPYYQDDHVTLYHGDCREIDAWLDADVLVTDPPYGVKWGGVWTTYTSRTRTDAITGDESPHVRDRVLELWGTKPAIVFGSWRVERPPNVSHRLIWWKKGQPPGPANTAFMTQDEEIYVLGSGFRPSSPPLRSVIVTSEARQGPSGLAVQVGHPTPKPVGLMEVLVDRCPPGVITDPFAGSGSTLLAAKNLGRRAVGVEVEERYCEIAANRLTQDVLDFGGAA